MNTESGSVEGFPEVCKSNMDVNPITNFLVPENLPDLDTKRWLNFFWKQFLERSVSHVNVCLNVPHSIAAIRGLPSSSVIASKISVEQQKKFSIPPSCVLMCVCVWTWYRLTTTPPDTVASYSMSRTFYRWWCSMWFAKWLFQKSKFFFEIDCIEGQSRWLLQVPYSHGCPLRNALIKKVKIKFGSGKHL